MENASTKVTLCSHTAEHSGLQIHRTIAAATNGIGNHKTITDWNPCTKSTDCNWAKSLAYYTFQSNTRLKYHRVSATVTWSPSTRCKKTFQFVTVKWKFYFTVTNLKNGQILWNGQMCFFRASALKKWPNILKLAMKWPIWQPCWWWTCSSLLSLQTHVAKLGAHCSAVALCCLTITWQRIFKGSLQVTIVTAFFRMWLLTSNIFGRWYSETVNADNGKTRCFKLCEKKQEWICSNASVSTSLKNPI